MTQIRAMKRQPTETYDVRSDHPELLQAIGSRIRAARLGMGASVEAFASNSGLTPTQLSHIEQGLLRISAVQLYNAAQYSNKPIGFFFTDPEMLPGGGPE